jgi:ribonuclease J
MNLKIHRGTNEIGGSCVELLTDNTRIIVDLGMPLVEHDNTEFNFSNYKTMSFTELVTEGILPDIPGLYDNPARKVDGIIISHPHQDHYGLLNYALPEIPVYIGEAAFELIKISNIFTTQKISISKPIFYKKNKPFTIGDFKITPYWNDHSAFDAYSFLIEADGKRIFYSGDFRSHGRKEEVFNWFLKHAPQNIDYLLLEGTTVGRKDSVLKSEDDIEKVLIELFKSNNKITLIYTSGQNIDRLVSIIRTCLSTNKKLVIDPYIANILFTVSKFSIIPYPSSQNNFLRVLFTKHVCNKLRRDGNESLMYNFKNSKIGITEIDANPGGFVIIVRTSMKADLEKFKNIDGGVLVYSLWEGYKSKPYTKEFLDYLRSRQFSMIDIHSSGHADISTLKVLTDTLNPKFIIPIHTFNKSQYKSIFSQNIISLNDKEVLEL